MAAESKGELRLLHVEDSEDDRELFQKALLRVCPGCQLDDALHPQEALAKLAQSEVLPHAIITDSTFSAEHRCDEFIAELRRRHPRIRVFAFSGRSDPDTIARAYEAGATGYFVKPATFDQLVRTIGVIALFLETCERL